jgi:hypothetical protein
LGDDGDRLRGPWLCGLARVNSSLTRHAVENLDAGRDSLRTPCFVVGEPQIVLPAFDEFVGASLVTM